MKNSSLKPQKVAEIATFRDENQGFYIIKLISQSISADFLPKSQEGCVPYISE